MGAVHRWLPSYLWQPTAPGWGCAEGWGKAEPYLGNYSLDPLDQSPAEPAEGEGDGEPLSREILCLRPGPCQEGLRQHGEDQIVQERV